MTLKLSNGLRNFINQNGSLKQALQNGKVNIYTGSQPATPETAVSGTLLNTYTAASGAHTAEVLATGTLTLNTGAAGSVDTLTVNSINILPASVPFNASLTQTAADVASAINKGLTDPEYTATSSGAVVTITALRGTGAGPNGYVVAATYTTITGTTANMSGGVTPVNGLQFQNSVSGTISKDINQIWSGVGIASGTAGWGRFFGSVADAGGTDSTDSTIRMDFSIGTSGSDLNLSPSTTITASATHTLSGISFTLPAA